MTVTTKEYRYRSGGGKIPNVPPQVAGEEAERIRDKRGKLTPEILIEESRHKNAVFHADIGEDWDDKIAGPKWRLLRARNIINSIVVVDHGEGGGEIEVQAFPNISIGGERESREYIPHEEVFGNGEMRESYLADVLARLRYMRMKYGHLKELAAVWDAIAETESKVAARN
jgi:hypothetical protein